jgi:hypothetical protein
LPIVPLMARRSRLIHTYDHGAPRARARKATARHYLLVAADHQARPQFRRHRRDRDTSRQWLATRNSSGADQCTAPMAYLRASSLCVPDCSASKLETLSGPRTTDSPSITKRSLRNFDPATTIRGKYRVQSWPPLLIRRTRSFSRTIRWPSHLISCSQS